jgi:hypothetical protein
VATSPPPPFGLYGQRTATPDEPILLDALKGHLPLLAQAFSAYAAAGAKKSMSSWLTRSASS